MAKADPNPNVAAPPNQRVFGNAADGYQASLSSVMVDFFYHLFLLSNIIYSI